MPTPDLTPGPPLRKGDRVVMTELGLRGRPGGPRGPTRGVVVGLSYGGRVVRVLRDGRRTPGYYPPGHWRRETPPAAMPTPDPADLTALDGETLLQLYAERWHTAYDAFRRTGRAQPSETTSAIKAELLRRLALVPPDAPAPEGPPRG